MSKSKYLYHLCDSLYDRIVALDEEVSNREDEISKEEATTLLHHLTQLYERFFNLEQEYVRTTDDYKQYVLEILEKSTSCDLTVIELKSKLTRMSSSAESTEVKHTSEPVPASKLESRIKKQKFHIDQIESFEINDTACPLEAQVLYEHVAQLYDRFVSNQAKINAQLDDAAQPDQHTITSQIQRKVLDILIKLKKIITPEISELDSLVKNSDFLIHQIELLEPKNMVCPDKAKISYNQLDAFYGLFISNQMKMEAQLTGQLLEIQQEISAKVQQNVMEWLTNLKKIFEPASVAVPLDLFQSQNTTTFSESGSTITQSTHEKMKTPDDIHGSENSSFTLDFIGEQLQISRDIRSDVHSIKEKQKQIQEDLKLMKEDFRSILFGKEKANSSLVNSSRSVGYKNNMNDTSSPGTIPPKQQQTTLPNTQHVLSPQLYSRRRYPMAIRQTY